MPFDSERFEPTDDVLKTLTDARALLQRRPCKSDHCVTTAVWEFTSSLSRECAAALRLLAAALPQRRRADNVCAIWRWHDDADTTGADILALFDRAIAARKAELLKTPELGAVGAS